MIIAVSGDRSTLSAYARMRSTVATSTIGAWRGFGARGLRICATGLDLDDVELQGVGEDVPEHLQRLARGLRAEAVGEHVAAQRLDVPRADVDRQLRADAAVQVAQPDALVADPRTRGELGDDVLAVPAPVAVGHGRRRARRGTVRDERRSAIELVAKRDRTV